MRVWTLWVLLKLVPDCYVQQVLAWFHQHSWLVVSATGTSVISRWLSSRVHLRIIDSGKSEDTHNG